jgi:NAD(P)H-flavin reductase
MASAMNERSLYAPVMAKIENTKILTATEKYFRLKLESGLELGHKPGQFVEVSIFGIGEAPISVSSSPTLKGYFELVVRNAGNVTGAMHKLEAGSTVGIRGPFGTSFPYQTAKGRDILFVAGGLGLAPARSFINYVLDNRGDYGDVTILFGARSPTERFFVDELKAIADRKDVNLLETVDRGDGIWKGNIGVITTLFSKINPEPSKTTCVVVGPPVMYKFVIAEAKKKKIADRDIVVSLERNMKCGVGKCGHCQINGKYCCQDGPVFTLEDANLLPEAF